MTSKNLHPGLPRESPHCHSLAQSPVRLLLEVGSWAQRPTLTKPIKTVIDKHSVLGKPWDFEGDSLYVAFYPSPPQGHSPMSQFNSALCKMLQAGKNQSECHVAITHFVGTQRIASFLVADQHNYVK